MGFLDWLFGKKKTEKEAENHAGELDLESATSTVKKKMEEETDSFWPRIEKFRSELRSRNEEFKKSIEKLRDAKPPEKIDEQVLKIGNTSRGSFAGRMSAIPPLVEKEFPKNLASFSDYYSGILSRIGAVNRESVKEFTSLSLAYTKETDAVVNNLREMKEKMDGFDGELKKVKETIGDLEKTLGNISELKGKNSEKEAADKRIESIKEGLKALELEKAGAEKELEELNASEKWNAYIQLNKEKEILEGEMRNIIEEVVGIFASIDRPLKKFAKAVDERYEGYATFKNKDMLKRYVESPFDGFIQDTDLETINSALTTIEEMVSTKKLNVGNSDEVLNMIGKIKSSDMLNKLAKKYLEVSEKIKIAKERIENHDYLRKRKELQDNISRIARGMEEDNKLLEREERSETNLEKEIERLKSDLRTRLGGIQ